jgi:drug/metabolite transporter (DMT)-like permease
LRSPAAHAVLFGGLLCVSTSGPFLVMAGMDALAVVFLRMALSAVVFLAWAAAHRELRLVPGQTRALIAGALLLATHFVLWVKAFDLTDYASNLLLLVAQPVMAAIVSVRLGERTARGIGVPIGLALVGLLLIAGGDFALGPRALLGDAFCILGGVAITFFYVVTRQARAAMPLATFVGLTFAIGAVAVAPLVWLFGAPLLAYPSETWLWLGLLVGVTTVLGHGLTNLAARHVSLFTVNLVIVLEPAIGLGLGWLLFRAKIGVMTVIGGAFLILSVLLGLRSGGRSSRTAPRRST